MTARLPCVVCGNETAVRDDAGVCLVCQSRPSAVQRVEAMAAVGAIRLCGRGPAKPLTEGDAQALVEFAEFLSKQPAKNPTEETRHV